nr:MAG TPA: hypothetical protein [Caudoviricetes sp.]
MGSYLTPPNLILNFLQTILICCVKFFTPYITTPKILIFCKYLPYDFIICL